MPIYYKRIDKFLQYFLRVFYLFFYFLGVLIVDKFGILKLANSFLKSFDTKNETAEQTNGNLDKSQSILSTITDALKNKSLLNANDDANKKVDKSKFNQAPLNQKMLATMQSHDKFIQRVKSNNPTK